MAHAPEDASRWYRPWATCRPLWYLLTRCCSYGEMGKRTGANHSNWFAAVLRTPIGLGGPTLHDVSCEFLHGRPVGRRATRPRPECVVVYMVISSSKSTRSVSAVVPFASPSHRPSHLPGRCDGDAKGAEAVVESSLAFYSWGQSTCVLVN